MYVLMWIHIWTFIGMLLKPTSLLWGEVHAKEVSVRYFCCYILNHCVLILLGTQKKYKIKPYMIIKVGSLCFQNWVITTDRPGWHYPVGGALPLSGWTWHGMKICFLTDDPPFRTLYRSQDHDLLFTSITVLLHGLLHFLIQGDTLEENWVPTLPYSLFILIHQRFYKAGKILYEYC